MQQVVLWHDTIDDATGAAVEAAGGVKRVAAKLWPAMEPGAAAAKLRACMNPDHAQKFSLDEWLMIAKLAREADDNSLMEFLGRELANKVEKIAPELAKKQAKRAKRLDLLEQLKRLEEE